MSNILQKKIHYTDLNARQQENYNFQKFAGRLADYGYNCIRLNDDWQGADFIACHIDGAEFLKIQLKGRFTIDKKYSEKDIYIAFIDADNNYYLYPHDLIMKEVLGLGKVLSSESWKEGQSYYWPGIPKWGQKLLLPYKMKRERK